MGAIAPVVVVAIATACRVAFGGEGIVASTSGDLSIWRLLDYGALGAFVIFLVWDRRQRDREAQETARRFEIMDKEMVAANKDAAIAMAVMSTAANELRASVEKLSTVLYTKPCLRPSDAKTRDTDRLPR